MKKKILSELYSLTPSQDTMHFMLKYSLHKQVMQIPMSMTVEEKIDFGLMKKALNIEIERNDCMRLRFVKMGREIKQYFISPYELDNVLTIGFNSKEEQEEFFNSDAQKPIRFLKDEVFRVVFFTSFDKKSGVYINVCHLNMDATSVFLFFSDLFAVYHALKSGEDMPPALGSFLDIIKKEEAYLANSKKLEADRRFYREFFLKDGEPFYAGVHGMDMLNKERQKKKNPAIRVPSAFDPIHDRANMLCLSISPDTTREIYEYCQSNSVSVDCLLQLGLRTHCSSINERIDDVYIMSLCSRRASPKEKNCGGCMTQPLPARSVISEDKTFAEAIAKQQLVQVALYRHMNYPYMDCRRLVQELYSYSMTASPSCMMFTWLPISPDALGEGVAFKLEGYNLGRYIMPLYAFAAPNASQGTIDMYYLYRTSVISKEQIAALHKNTVKVLQAGIKNPEQTVGDLLDMIG